MHRENWIGESCRAHPRPRSGWTSPPHLLCWLNRLQLALLLALRIFPLLSTGPAVRPVCTCLPTPCVSGFPHGNQPPTPSENHRGNEVGLARLSPAEPCRHLTAHSSLLTEHINPGFNNLSSDFTRLQQSPVCHVSKQPCPSR